MPNSQFRNRKLYSQKPKIATKRPSVAKTDFHKPKIDSDRRKIDSQLPQIQSQRKTANPRGLNWTPTFPNSTPRPEINQEPIVDSQRAKTRVYVVGFVPWI